MKKILAFILLFTLTFQARASHLMGGEITWTCQPNGQFIFKMILYRDCNGIPIPTGTQTLDVFGNPLLTSLSLNQSTITDITYCQPTYNCYAANPPSGATEEGVFISNPITLSGVPPAGGWTFAWHSCCRNGALTNINAGGFSLRATMFPYNGQNVNPCFDGSPDFAERPSTVLCTGFPFTYNHSAFDPELDSLVYAWGQPLDEPQNAPPSAWNPGSNPPITNFIAPFSIANPLPFNAPNVGATINASNGEISYTCYTAGNYMTCTKVTAFKCGIKVAEVYREIQVVMLGNCPLTVLGTVNKPPVVIPPFKDINGVFNSYKDTVYAGDTVDFWLNAADFDFVLPGPTLQSIEVTGKGSQFGVPTSNPNSGCLIPPCATTSPTLPSINNIAGSNIHFTWVTTCDHVKGLNIGCVNLSNTYTFVIRNQDNFCPAPAIAVSTISITVLAPPKIDSSLLRGADVALNGDITVYWAKPRDKKAPYDTASSFYCYQIWKSNTAIGPYVLIDSVFNVNDTSYTDTTANGQVARSWYHTITKYGCDGAQQTGRTDSICSILLDVTSPSTGVAKLDWNPIHVPLLSSSLKYYKIYRETPPGTWTLLDSTMALTYNDTVSIICNDTLNYRVQIEDSIRCISKSSIDGIRFSVSPVPDPPVLHCIAVGVNGSQTLTWVPPVDTAVEFDGYFLYHNNGGAYTLYDSIFNYNTLSTIDNSVNANTGSVGHYLKSRSACGPAYSIQGDTLKSIYLTVANVAGNANLTWTAMRTPKLPSASNYYRIYKEYPAGTWSLIDSTTALTYVDVVHVCNDSINYQIKLPDASGCTSSSNIKGARFLDNTIPLAPVIRCLAVSPAGSVTISWKAPVDTGLDFNSYHIYYSLAAGGPFTLIDSIFNYSQTTYTHTVTAANAQSVYYQIKTRTGCGVQYSLPSATAATILLNVGGTNTSIANLTWNALATPNLATSTGIYKVYRKIGTGGGWTFIKDRTTLSYSDTLTLCIDSVFYRIEIGDSLPCTSISNEKGNRFVDNSIPQPPVVHCISVGTNGAVTLAWQPPVDTARRFNSYHIYYSTNAGGPFNLIDSIFNYNQTSYTHVAANGNTQSLYYQIKTRSGCGVQYSAPSQTIHSIYLTVGGANTTVANLAWNSIMTPALSSASGTYTIFRKIAANGWTLLTSTNSLNYNDTLTLCIDSVKYRIETGDNLPCVSVSNVNGDRFVDNSIPDPPVVHCISVAGNGSVTLTWQTPSDTAGRFNSYHIYYSTNAGGPFNIIDSIFNYSQTSYTHTSANANAQSLYYQVETRSGCGVQYSVPSQTIRSIYLNVGGGNTSVANLAWNAVTTPNLPSASGTYNVFRNIASAGWSLIASTNSLAYNDSLILCIDTVKYRIETGDNLPCVSVSNVNGDRFVDNTIPDPPVLHCVSVAPNGNITLSWEPPLDTARQFNSYHIYSSTNAGGPFIEIDSIFNYNTSNYIHAGANGNLQSVYYQVKTRSGCGVQYSLPSETLQSIFLSVTGAGTTTANLSWNALHTPNLPSSSGTYKIFKEFPTNTWTQIGTTSGLTYNDPMILCIEQINYRVEISDNLPCNSVSSVNGALFVDHTIPAAPDPRCVSVLLNGDVVISWNAPVDTGMDFNSYHIYASNSAGGPFSEIDSIFDYEITTATHFGANANNQEVYYMLKTRTGCGVEYSLPSETVASMKLNVTNAGNGVAKLNWNAIHTPVFPTASGVYEVYKEYPSGSWNFVATTVEPQYFDTITVCSEIINYYVQTSDNLPCSSVSSRDGDLFKDVLPPAVPMVDTVTVNPFDSLASITWNVNPSGDTKGYIIYKKNGLVWDSIGATADINAITVTNGASLAAQGSEVYAVAAFDSCGNLSPLSVPHNTIFLQVALNKCKGAIDLSWVSYQNMESGVDRYIVYASENGGPYLQIGFASGTETTWSHAPLTKYATYCYYLQAVSANGLHTSSSNIDCEFADVLQLPTFSYLKKVTVTGPRNVYAECYVDTAADVTSYRLMRALKLTGPYATIGISYDTLNAVISFDDSTAKTQQTDYYYIVIATSNCGQDVFTTNIGHSIFLKAKPLDNLVNKVEWNDYEDWLGKVQNYKLYRKVDNATIYDEIADIPFGSTTYMDDVSKFYTGEGRFCYYVQAFEGPGDSLGFIENSLSNEGCAIQAQQLYTPNAFTPDGKNPVFMPVHIFTAPGGFYMVVFNRWGEKVFESKDPKTGWDGKFKGSMAQEGTYVYYVRIYGNDGEKKEQRGWVNLLK